MVADCPVASCLPPTPPLFLLQNLGFLTPFWDVVMGTRWHPEHPLWLEWQRSKAAGKVFDTLDGSKDAWRNDAFSAYDASGPKAKLL